MMRGVPESTVEYAVPLRQGGYHRRNTMLARNELSESKGV